MEAQVSNAATPTLFTGAPFQGSTSIHSILSDHEDISAASQVALHKTNARFSKTPNHPCFKVEIVNKDINAVLAKRSAARKIRDRCKETFLIEGATKAEERCNKTLARLQKTREELIERYKATLEEDDEEWSNVEDGFESADRTWEEINGCGVGGEQDGGITKAPTTTANITKLITSASTIVAHQVCDFTAKSAQRGFGVAKKLAASKRATSLKSESLAEWEVLSEDEAREDLE